MPNRIIKESALDSYDLDGLSHGAERLFWRLIVVADDYGRFEGSPQVIKARCFPRKVDSLATTEVQKWMKELQPNLVQFYLANGREYGVFINWLKHQQKRANKSKFPDPPKLQRLRVDSNCNQLQSNVLGIEIEIENEIGSEGIRIPSSESQKSGSSEWPPDWLWLKKYVSDQKLVELPVELFQNYAWWNRVSFTCGGVDKHFLEMEFAKMGRWLQDNPRRKPTPKGFRQFVAGWLERAHEKERRFKIAK